MKNYHNIYAETAWKITGIKESSDCSADAIFKSVGKAIGVPLSGEDISIAHSFPSFNTNAPPKLIVKFTRRSVRNNFYSKRKNLANVKVKDLPDLSLNSPNKVFISESLTPYRKKLFGNVNQVRKRLNWRFIWTNNGKIYTRESESTPIFAFETEEDFSKFEANQPAARQLRPRAR